MGCSSPDAVRDEHVREAHVLSWVPESWRERRGELAQHSSLSR